MMKIYHLPITNYLLDWRTVLKLLILNSAILIIASCSTTSRISDDDPLYTGIKKINVQGKNGTDGEDEALEEMNGALAYAPNNSLFGSSSVRYPLPIGLWVYNGMNSDSIKGFRRWMYNLLAATPRTISSASPATRAKVANNVLQNYGYFNSTVDYSIITNPKNPRKQKVSYDVNLGKAYTYKSIRYALRNVADSIVKANSDDSYLATGKQFSVADLQSEKSRLTTIFHNNGYYYYRSDYIKYYADTINNPGQVKLLVQEDDNMPEKAKRQWKFGKISVFLRNNTTSLTRRTSLYDDTIHKPRFDVAFQGKKVPIRLPIMMRNFKFWTGMKYSEDRVNRTLTQLTNMNSLSSVQFSFTPADTTDSCRVLDVRLDATMDKLVDAEFEFNFTQKSNSQIGPDASLTLSRRNAFRNGEKLSLTLRGSYYWQTRHRSKNKINNIDSYEWGVDATLDYPWTVFPYFLKHNFYRPTSTEFKASFTRTNIAKYFRYNQFGLGVNYTFKSSSRVTHTFSPLSIDVLDIRGYSDSLHYSDKMLTSLLRLASSNILVPYMQYNFTYDNSSESRRSFFTKLMFTLKESGNIISGVKALCGQDWNEKNKRLIKGYAQFVRAQLEVRNKLTVTPKSCIATRALIGVAIPYGNSSTLPISECFYSGGAYSVRAFPARSLGPGMQARLKGESYVYHMGNLRVEFNAEYRFPLFGNINGAVFVDAGNVWLTYSNSSNASHCYYDVSYPESYQTDGVIRGKYFFKELALGTGFGVRYDMDVLVVRLDLGIALHAPYRTTRSGYYNIPRFWKDGTNINFAVGYPF